MKRTATLVVYFDRSIVW